MPQLKIPRAATKTQCSPINKYYKRRKRRKEKGGEREQDGGGETGVRREGRRKWGRGEERKGEQETPGSSPPTSLSWKVTSL